MKVALIQDQLLTKAGSERVFLHLCDEFKEADIFTLCYNGKTTWPEFQNKKITTHWLGRFIKNHQIFKICFPLSTFLMQMWNFRDYDLIISSSATTAKYIKNHNAFHLCYCYFPTRAIWNSNVYFGSDSNLVGKGINMVMGLLRKRDIEAARRVDKFIAISDVTKKAIRTIYDMDSEIVFSPIVLPSIEKEAIVVKCNYYLLVSRLEKWKLVDYAIKAFNELGLNLHIVGTGPEESLLRTQANSNIVFLGSVTDIELSKYYAEAQAVVFTPELEYGLVPLEAAAYGTTTIALGRGGVLETMICDDGQLTKELAIFFPDPTSESLKDAVNRFQETEITSEQLIRHSKKFAVHSFQSQIRNISDRVKMR